MKPLYLIGGAAVALYILSEVNGTKNAIEGLNVYVTNPSKPKLSGFMMEMDVMVNIDNHSNKLLRLDALEVAAYSRSGNAWTKFASSVPQLGNLEFNPKATTRIPVTMQTSFMNAGMELYNLLQNGGAGAFKFTVTPTFLGVRIPPIASDVFEINAGKFFPKGKEKA